MTYPSAITAEGAGSAPSECRAARARPRPVPRPAQKGALVMTDPPSRHPVRQSMTVRAPPSGRRAHDVPLAITAGAPGHGRPRAARMVPDRQRSHHAPMARPGHCHWRAPAHPCLSATTPLPAQRVIPALQERLSRITVHSRTNGGTYRGAIPPETPRTTTPRTPTLPPTRTLPLHHPSRASTHHGSNRGASLTTDGRRCASCHPGTDPPVHPPRARASRAKPTPVPHRLVIAVQAAIHVPPRSGGTIG